MHSDTAEVASSLLFTYYTKTNQVLATGWLISVCMCVFQAIKQMYVLVLGLDVLGNPFGLIRGLSQGVEAFFYEPYQVGMEYLI